MMTTNHMTDHGLTEREQVEQASVPSTPNADITVIGAGIIGLANAIALQKAGFRVRVIDKQGVAAGASFGNAGHFATEQVFPLADPAMLPKLPGMLLDPLGPFRIQPRYFLKALPWFMRFLVNMLPARRAHNSAAIKALNQKSISAWQQLVSDCACPELLKLEGSLLVFEQTPSIEVERVYQSYRAAGVAVKLLSGDEVRGLEPDLSPNIKHGLWFTDVGHTQDPTELCQRLATQFSKQGGELVIGEVTGLRYVDKAIEGGKYEKDEQGEQAVSVCVADGANYQSDKLLLSAGAWSKPLARQLGFKVPLETERGYHLMMPQQSRLQRPVASFERKFIITPMSRGTCLAGTVEFGGLKAPLVEARADCLLPHAKALLPGVLAGAKTSQGERWMGFRPSLPDSLPVLGASPKSDKIFFAFGHQHLGLTWAAFGAELMAKTIKGEKPLVDMSPYRIDRF
ncbi:FAD-dependent oxidoreductase [Shewanella sp. JBTF-M18]|uniref:FAD-dependent oxidoreductase n=1 Tax=Shewanella insulae TaxID=2681496 RepID=A0A6L7I1I3_9GAMM|nr:FAD-dependent oxidoreductase [Shewanella insulae]MXR69151.1 FAD-dependent oxidoreductase [Shewanella insulae]